MTFVTVFRRVPPPVIGMIGVLPERTFAAFEKDLDWLETTGVLVERFEPDDPLAPASPREAARRILEKEGEGCLPLVLVDGVPVSQGVHPTRSRLARLVGRGRQEWRPAPAA